MAVDRAGGQSVRDHEYRVNGVARRRSLFNQLARAGVEAAAKIRALEKPLAVPGRTSDRNGFASGLKECLSHQV